MKKLILTILIGILIFPVAVLRAQQVEASLNQAKAAYSAGNLEEARYALQQAMNQVDLALAEEILKLLPAQMGEMPYTDEDETVGSAAIGFAGLYVSRTYRSDENTSATLQVMADSPMLAGLNAILALPMIGSDPDNKRIRLAGYRGLLQKQEDETGIVTWDLQVPFGASLLSINFEGINDEKKIMEMANTIAVDQIAAMLQ
ncbi:MAG: hypothetical protein R6U64_01210 [Bacteroidales bacterium]